MSIQDFLKETKRLCKGEGLSPAQEEIQNLALMLYRSIKGGSTKRWVREAAEMFVKSIAPDLSPTDLAEAVFQVEGIALTVLCELLDSGVIIKKEVHKNETREQG